MKSIGRINTPQEAFIEVLKTGSGKQTFSELGSLGD